MIVPIHGLKYHSFDPVRIDDSLILVKEKDNIFDDNAVAVFNLKNQKVG